MKILYYLTAHGYGHAVRSVTLCNELSENVRLIFRTTLPSNFFHEEVKRPFDLFPARFDCGCVQKDSVTVDTYEDLIASADAMITKIGYGVTSQGLVNGTPLIYLPRQDFAEFPVLEQAIREWGHGYRLSREDYRALNWGRALEEIAKRKRPEPVASDGARICAREIENWIRRSSSDGSPGG